MKLHELPCPPVEGARVVPVRGLRQGQVFEAQDWVAEEVPVALVYNGISHAVMLATPSDLEDFAWGFSLTEGIVDHQDQIYGVEIRSEPGPGGAGLSIELDIAARCEARLKDRRRTLAGRTGCGLCGTDSLEHAITPVPPLQGAGPGLTPEVVAAAMEQMRSRQRLLSVTGASHAAAWCTADGNIARLREDVGRHNALDKLIGALLRTSVDPSTGFIAVTSRASYEMVHKTAAVGVYLLAAVSGVTGLAVDQASAAGLTLVGFARGRDLTVYTCTERLFS